MIKSWPRKFVFLFGLVLGLWFSLARITPLPSRLYEECSQVVYYGDGRPAHVFLAPDERWRIKLLLEEIDPNYIRALLSIEDQRFYWHAGVDPLAIARAAWQNIASGQIISGASTISMQLVRVLEPRPRNLRSKIIESFRATQLEMQLSKEEILAAYLTFIPFGRNIEGVEAASLSYFGHRANHLNADEIAILIAVPQNPVKRYPNAANQLRLQHARDHIATLLEGKNTLPLTANEQIEEVIFSKPVPDTLKPFPRQIPHLSQWIAQNQGTDPVVNTTIDWRVQNIVEERLQEFQPIATSWHIHNAAVVVLHVPSQEFRALAGGFDFWSKRDGSQIPAFLARRSSGSTLKPFLYTAAIEQGLMLPQQLVPDIPSQYGDYIPRNYDGQFSGLISLEEALSRSLNIPFVNLLRELGLGQFLFYLRQLGIESFVRDKDEMGLSAAVGVYLQPVELATAFAVLANKGRAIKPTFLQGKARTKPAKQIFSEEAVWLNQRALARRDRPDFPQHKNDSVSARKISWKTGTSVGHRDAWSAGWFGDYVVVVWLGNLNNQASSKLIGSSAAGPLMFDILERLDTTPVRQPKNAEKPPKGLIEVEVCAYSGHIPNRACPQRHQVLARQTRVPVIPCPYHLNAEVEITTGLRVAPMCRQDRESKMSTFLRLPSAVQRWMGTSPVSLPPMAPGCEGFSPILVRDGDLRIRSPRAGQLMMLISGITAERQKIPFFADYPDPNAHLQWFVNDKFVGKVMASEKYWWTPQEGRHTIEVRDTKQHSDKQVLEVKSSW